MALQKVISTEVQLVDRLQCRANAAAKRNPAASQMDIILCKPPLKTTLWQKTASAKERNKDGLTCQSTFALSAEIKLGLAQVSDHRLADAAAVTKSVLFCIDKDASEGGKVDAAADGSGKTDEDGWRRSFRRNIAKLVEAMRIQIQTNFSGFCERRDLPARRAAFMEKGARQKAADKSVRQVLKENAASSSS